MAAIESDSAWSADHLDDDIGVQDDHKAAFATASVWRHGHKNDIYMERMNGV